MATPEVPASERPTLEMPVVGGEPLTDRLADCRNGHAQLKADEPRWAALPLVGYSPGDVDGVALELRNCTCGSTVAREFEQEVA